MPRDILIVHDSPLLRQLVQSYALAEFSDTIVETAESAEEALKMFEARTFDVVISALDMPGMNGLEFYRRLKSKNIVPETPFVIMASTATEDQKKRLEDEGVNYALFAPYTGRDFANVVNLACQPRRKRAHDRFNVPGTEAALHLMKAEIPVKVLNISLNGILCEMFYEENLPDFFQPGLMDIAFPQEYDQVRADGILTALSRLKVMTWRANHLPDRLRVAWSFVEIPNPAQETLKRVLEKVDQKQTLSEEDLWKDQ